MPKIFFWFQSISPDPSGTGLSSHSHGQNGVSLGGRQRWTQSLSWPEQWVLEVPAGRPQGSLVVGGILSTGPCLIYPGLVSMTTTSSLPLLFILKRFPPQLSEPGLLAQLPYQPTAPEPRFSSELSSCQRVSWEVPGNWPAFQNVHVIAS